MRLVNLHRGGALVLAPFLLLHMGNHLVAIRGVDEHIALMNVLRQLYRHPLVEALLLAAVALQLGTGWRQLSAAWRQRASGRRRLQALSGLLLAAFIAIHVAAVLFARHGLGLDTNFHFAAAGMHVPPMAWFFVPYYGLAVVALFTHLGCAAGQRIGRTNARGGRCALRLAVVGGLATAAAIVAAMLGLIRPYSPPAEYLAPIIKAMSGGSG
jgi:succinate dehydrogenase/fumarate reductase cytochrome b subunit